MALNQHQHPGGYNRIGFRSPQLDVVDPTIPFLPLEDPAAASQSPTIRFRTASMVATVAVAIGMSAFAAHAFNAMPANIIPVRQAALVHALPTVPVQPQYGKVVPFVAGTQAFIRTRYGNPTPGSLVGFRTSAYADYVFNATPAPVIPIRTRALSELAEVPRLVLPRYTPFPYGTVAPANPVIPIRTRPLAELRDARFIATPSFISPNVTEPVAPANPPINIRQQNPSLGVPGRLINSIYWNETLYYHYRPHLPIQVRRLEELRVEPRLVMPQVLPFPYWTPPPPANPVIPIQMRDLTELRVEPKLVVPQVFVFPYLGVPTTNLDKLLYDVETGVWYLRLNATSIEIIRIT